MSYTMDNTVLLIKKKKKKDTQSALGCLAAPLLYFVGKRKQFRNVCQIFLPGNLHDLNFHHGLRNHAIVF